jgi:L-seryl-tRNA(Ser) seleniumtransferase
MRSPNAIPVVIPSVDRVMNLPDVLGLCDAHGRSAVVGEVRGLLAELRAAALAGQARHDADAELARLLGACLSARLRPRLRRVFNLTGTVLHTNLGRALLPESAVEHVAVAMCEPCNLEFDLEGGERGDRDSLVEGLLCELTGADAATVVNNNAAAVLLTVAALAARKEVVVSR